MMAAVIAVQVTLCFHLMSHEPYRESVLGYILANAVHRMIAFLLLLAAFRGRCLEAGMFKQTAVPMMMGGMKFLLVFFVNRT